jgi:flavin reductase (DIM6/NTAB) family NADH-FMN oxidoreductase RutF
MNNHAKPQHPDLSTHAIEAFKRAFRRHAAGVAVITTVLPNGAPAGFTATSLASLAASPPLATFNMAQISSSWPAMTVGNHVVIHTLGPRSRHHAERMAAANELRFVGGHWHPGPQGIPILDGATAWLLGRVIAVYPAHGNAVVIVEIEQGELGEADDALLYHERAYRKPGSL